LFVSRTAHEWMWDYIEPLANLLQPNSPPPSFKHNISSPEMARNKTRSFTLDTGVDGVSQVMNSIEFEGYTSINSMYPTDIPVHGTTEDGQFPPFIKCGTTQVGTFNNEYVRYIPFECSQTNFPVLNVKTDRFLLPQSVWDASPEMGSYVAGFCNMSGKFNNSPVFLSNPHYYGVPDGKWISRVEGAPTQQNITIDQTRVDIEPNTGKIMQLAKSAQVNLYIPNDTIWFTSVPNDTTWVTSGYNPNVYRDVMFPVFVGRQTLVITPELAEEITGKVYKALHIRVIIWYVLLGSLVFMTLLAALVGGIAFHRSRKPASGYLPIQ